MATPAVDGVYSEFTLLPPANVIFLGAFTPDNPQWFAPNVDTFTFHLPEDAEPGTYKVTLKGRGASTSARTSRAPPRLKFRWARRPIQTQC